MEPFNNKNQCCGCTACYSVCPTDAITMEYDKEGFLYPSINNALCVNCGKCRNACAFQKGYEEHPVICGYALKHKDIIIRKSSRSGGAFAGIANFVLNLDGVVYGAVYNDDYSVQHFRCESKKDLVKLQGVKYIQSEMKDIFAQVREDVKAGKYVLFSGTPCQVAGLIATLKNINRENLYTADLICHGVPNNMIWQEFLRWTERKYKGKLEKALFRDKSYGWNTHFESVTINGKKHKTKRFCLMFYENDILRPSCYECKYANLNRVGDFTLGDFWGIKRQYKDFVDKDGCSLFLINTKKGQDIFDKIKDDFILRDADVVKASYPNPNLRFPTAEPQNRDYFWQLHSKYAFDKVMTIYYLRLFVSRVKKRLNRVINMIKK